MQPVVEHTVGGAEHHRHRQLQLPIPGLDRAKIALDRHHVGRCRVEMARPQTGETAACRTVVLWRFLRRKQEGQGLRRIFQARRYRHRLGHQAAA